MFAMLGLSLSYLIPMGAVQSNLRRARGGPGGSQDLVAGMVVESLLAGEK